MIRDSNPHANLWYIVAMLVGSCFESTYSIFIGCQLTHHEEL